MSVLIVVSLLSIWFYLGWLSLGFARVEDDVVRGMLAPAVGMAIVTLVTTTASLVGLPINQSKWIVVLMLGGSIFVFRRAIWSGFLRTASLLGFAFVLNLLTFGIGLIVFGTAWHGLINGDATTNSLAAQYFMTHSFFAEPGIESISTGLDYSPLSSMLFVAGGSRFGDVMLLGHAASLFNLNPDEVYMSHAMAIRCAMIASASLLVYRSGDPAWKLIVAITILTASPLGAYSYLNQLISQAGGTALLLAAAILVPLLLDHPDKFTRLIWPLCIVIAALFQSYPEAVSLLVLGVFLFGLHRAHRDQLPSIPVLGRWLALLALLVLVLLNVSLPNVLSHMFGAMASVGMAHESISPISDFGYAFTPDAFPILLGFEGLREAIAEPWALALQLTGLALTGVLALFAIRRFDRYPLLLSLSLAALIAGLFLGWQRSDFGTFKMMLLAQPLIFAMLAALLIELFVVRKLLGVMAGCSLLLLSARGANTYLSGAMTALGAIPHLAQGKMLDRLQGMVSGSSSGVIIEAPSYLFGKFAALRTKTQRTVFEQNVLQSFASRNLKTALTNTLTPLRPNQDAFWNDLSTFYQSSYKSVAFQCGPPETKINFEMLSPERPLQRTRILVAGSQLIPLNGNRYGDFDIKLLDAAAAADFLAFRPSSLGGYYLGEGHVAALFNMEHDVFTSSNMAATGRHILLEIMSPSAGKVRLGFRFTRTYMGSKDTRLPEVKLYGAETVSLGTAGAGAMGMTSPPLRPCIIEGRSFILVEIAAEPNMVKKSVPWAYQLLDVPYVPDSRRITGFLRDISVVSADPKEKADRLPELSAQWNFGAFESSFEYSGMFEDGWMSDHVILRPRRDLRGRKITFGMDVPGELAAQHALLDVAIDGKAVRQQLLSAGRISVQIDLPPGIDQIISLSSPNPLVLPGGDGRSTIGLLRSITTE